MQTEIWRCVKITPDDKKTTATNAIRPRSYRLRFAGQNTFPYAGTQEGKRDASTSEEDLGRKRF